MGDKEPLTGPRCPPPQAPSRRRRWARWGFILALPVILYGGLLTYDTWRPLSEAERRLVGTWMEVPTMTLQKTEMTFTADRRLEMTIIAPQGIRLVIGAGSWSVRGNDLRFRLDRRPEQTPATIQSWKDIPFILARPFSRFTGTGRVVFEGEDRIDWGGARYDRVREATKSE